jgi:integrase
MTTRNRLPTVKPIYKDCNWCLRFRYRGHQYNSSYGDGTIGKNACDAVASKVTGDLQTGNFDTTFEKYRMIVPGKPKTSTPKRFVTIHSLWALYCEFRQPQVAETTYKKQYEVFTKGLKDIPFSLLEDAPKVRDWLLAHKSVDATKRYLTQLNACVNWAIDSGLVESNPFAGMASKIRVTKSTAEDDINPFFAYERDEIIAAFQSHKSFSHYYNFVRFLFFTGCRPSEAVALKWGNTNNGSILFCETAISSSGKPILKKGLKTQASRRFPINAQLREIMEDQVFICMSDVDVVSEQMLVFPSPNGKIIDTHNFSQRAWKTVLASLPTIECRSPYQTRHTFITLALEAGFDAKDVAKWCGNSAEMIYKHYAGSRSDLSVPLL